MSGRARSLVAIAGLAILAGACSSTSDDSAARERAYRANNRGVALLEQFAYEEAAVAFRSALGVDPVLPIAHVNLSLALLYAQDLEGARTSGTEAARLLPDAPQPPYILGLIARAENRTEDALREFQRVHALDPEDVGASVNLGQISMEQREYAEAIDLLRQAVEREAYNVTAAYNLGLALTRSGAADEGREWLDRAQELRATGYAVTYGTGYLEQGRYAEALTSTGAEPDLVDAATPAASFVTARIGDAGAPPPPPSPFGRTFTAADLTPDGARELAAGLGGCLTLLDADGDGDLDLVSATANGQRLYRNDGAGVWTDVTAGSGLDGETSGVPVACVAGDVNNDGRTDLLVLRHGLSSLYRNESGGRFSEADRTALPDYGFLPGAVALTDVDHDGDLDIVVAGLADVEASRARAAGGALVFPDDFVPAPVALWRNSGEGTFTDITAEARITAATHAVAIVPTDFDNRRDVDLLVVSAAGPPLLFQNLRDGTFRDVAAETGLAAAAGSGARAVTAADINHDGFTDFFFGRPGGGVFALSDGRGRFTAEPAPAGASAGRAAQFVDYDLDGLLDLVTWDETGPAVIRNLGTRWADVTRNAVRNPSAPPASARSLVVADLNADGRADLATSDGTAIVAWHGQGDSRQSMRVDLAGRVSNRNGIGARIEVRAGSLRTRFERSAASPAVAPADVVVGLGDRPGADAVRVLWPSGILQAEAGEASLPAALSVEELDRKPSSCPFLFVWNGDRFEFVTDFLGAGEMGYWLGPDLRNTPDPVEYVRIPGDRIQPRDGRFELRVTNELEEVLFLDRLHLLAVAHPEDAEVYPDEGMTGIPKPFRVIAVRDPQVPRARDDRGRDVTARIASIDRQYVDGFDLERLRGYAASHALTLELARDDPAPVLLLTGWTDYAFSSDNVAAHHAGLALVPPRLEVRAADGQWRTVVEDVGVPVGRPQTVTVDLSGRLRPGERELRIVTSMRIYWDRILVGTSTDRPVTMDRLDPSSATLRTRGYSAEIRPDGHEPPVYDYSTVSRRSPWKTMVGHYTREGDVRDLLAASDDMFVVARTGDEIAVAFEAALPALPEGWTRTFLLMADGYSKEMDINSATPDAVEPLPFHAMTSYPYGPDERYPETRQHDEYRSTYNTRIVSRPLPSIDTLVLE